jgi:hypothetical protein
MHRRLPPLIAVWLCALAAFLPNAFAAEVKLAPPAAERLKEKLDVSFNVVPLADVIAHLRRALNLNIVVDPLVVSAKLLEQGVSLDHEGVALKTVLDTLAETHGVGYRLEGRIIWLVLAEDMLLRPVEMKIYDLSDLASPLRDYPAPDFAQVLGGVRAAGKAAVSEGLMDLRMAAEGESVSSLADTIQSLAPEIWAPEFGTSVEQRGHKLIIFQRPKIHAEIKALLRDIRRHRSRMITFNVRVFEGAVDISDALLRGQPNESFLNDAGNRKLGDLLRAGKLATSGVYRTTCFNTQQTTFLAGGQHVYLADLIPQDGALDPVYRILHSGMIFQVRPILAEGRDEIVLDLRLTRISRPKRYIPPVRVGRKGGVLKVGDANGRTVDVAGPARVQVPHVNMHKVRTTLRVPSGGRAVFTTTRHEPGQDAREIIVIVEPAIVIVE